MKHFLITTLLSIAAISSNAQAQSQGVYQFEDPGFEKYTSGEEPGHGWNSFKSATGLMASFGKKVSPNPIPMEDGANGTKRSVKIYSKSAVIANANGNLTTGIINMGDSQPTNSKNYNFTKLGDSAHSLRFAGRPDAVTFYAKFKSGEGNSKKCGNANFILHDETEYRDPQIDSQKGHRIGIASQAISESSTWVKYDVAFKYDKAQTDVQYLLASVTTNPIPGESFGDSLYFDEVYFVYYNTLKSLTYTGSNIAFSENATTYDLSSVNYEEANLSYELKGAGASATKNYDATTGLLTITVNGNDISVNPNNKTVYTIQFAKPHANGTGKLLSLEVNGNSVSNFTSDNLYYTVVDEYVENGITFTAEDGEDATISVNYNSENRIATITVNANYGNAESTYKVKFAKPTTDYVGKMLISMVGNFLAAGNDPVGITSPNNGFVDFQLLNFQLEGMGLIGDIFITDVPYAPNEKGDVTLNKEQSIVIFGAAGESLGILPVTLNAEVIDGQLKGKIDIIWEGLPIVVDIYPFNTTFMDIPAIGANNNMDAIKQNMTNKNLLIYLTEEVNNMDNIIVNDQCANLVLSDGYAFNAPKAFTAANVSYTRLFKAGNLSSFVMPFSLNTNDINGKVYQLTGIEGDVLQFETVNGTTEANQPYIIDMNGTSLFNTIANANVAAATSLNNVKGNAAHIGSFTTQQIVSDAVTSYYGYSNGNFVKANTGTLNPFRTAIKVTGVAAQALALSLDGNITGIGCITNDTLDLNANVDVYDINGRIVRKNVKAATSLQGLPNGVYVVNGKKIIKK